MDPLVAFPNTFRPYHMTKNLAILRTTMITLVGGTILFLLGQPLLARLLDTGRFMPHSHCYLQNEGVTWLHAVSDSLIAIAYLGISIALVWLLQRTRKHLPYGWMVLAFGIFIVACGATHGLEVWTLWNPTYWLSGTVKAITAVASVGTAFALPPLIPKIVGLVQTARLSEERRKELEHRNDELRELYERVKELDEAKSRFFANVSHEIRAPLTLISGPAERLMNDATLDAEQRERAEGIHRNARLLLNHVHDLLDLSKFEAGRMRLQKSIVDLAQRARLVASHFESYAAERNVALRLDVPQRLVASADIESFDRIVMNLLSNALKFTPQRGTVRVTLTADGNEAVLEVADSGRGVVAADRERIFDPYEQAGTNPSGGTGLGLAIARENARLHGGSIVVTDAPEGGALFRVRLPLELDGDRAQESQAGADSLPSGPTSGREPAIVAAPVHTTVEREEIVAAPLPDDAPLVLVAEDNPEMSRFIADTLATRYRVATASTGREALERAEELSPDAIISDIMMPEMNGEELLRAVRTRPELEGVPFIVLTARGDEEKRVELLRIGAQDYLAKPFLSDELLLRTGTLVEMKLARDILQRLLASRSNDIATLVAELAQRNHDLEATMQRLQISESRYRRLADANLVGIGISKRDGSITEANDAFLDMIGYSREDLDAGRINFYEITPESDHSITRGAVAAVNADGVVPPFEKEYIRKDGTRVPALVGAATIEGLDGHHIFLALDLTRLKETQEEVRRLNAELEERVQRRTAELEAANEELEAFSYSVSHDLRGPLRSIDGFTRILAEDYASAFDDTARDYMDRILRSVGRMSELIDALLALSKITRGEMVYDEVDLSRIAGEIADELRLAEPERNVTFQIRPGGTAIGNPKLLRAAMENLIGNAWKFTRKTSEGVIEFVFVEGPDETTFTVSDNGAGFDAKHAEQIFAPFQRLHADNDYPGHGIGLATVQRIIRRHGGTIRAEGDPGEGAAFHFTLPNRRLKG